MEALRGANLLAFMTSSSAGDVARTTEAVDALPRWARRLDAVCFGLLLLALVVAQWGGFREQVGSMRVALTSPWRVLAVAILLGAVRHWRYPSPAIWIDLPPRLMGAARSDAAKIGWRAFFGTRPVILFLGFMAVSMFGYRMERPPIRFSDNELMNLQVRWDMGWYYGIAVDGYLVLTDDPRAQQNIVFFPAFPMATRVVGRLLGGSAPAFIAAGTIVALVAFFWAMTYLFRLAREETGDADRARFAVWLVAAYPFAVFFSAFYTESLYLLGVLGAFYHFRRRELWKAGVWGLLVGLTRPNGCFLSIPLAVLAVMPWLPTWLGGGPADDAVRAPERKTFGALASSMVAAAMPGIGVLLYSAYIWRLTGNPIAWAAGHAAWGREYNGLWSVVVDRYNWLFHIGVYEYLTKVPFDVLNSLGALFVLAAVIPAARRLGLAYAVFILVNLLPPLAEGGMLSIGRLTSVLFPAFLWYAAVVPERHRSGWLTVFMAGQGFCAALFYTWRELF